MLSLKFSVILYACLIFLYLAQSSHSLIKAKLLQKDLSKAFKSLHTPYIKLDKNVHTILVIQSKPSWATYVIQVIKHD